jgi:hypothetical protein
MVPPTKLPQPCSLVQSSTAALASKLPLLQLLMGRHNVSPQTNTLVSSYPIHPIRPILLTRAAQLASASAAARPAAEAPSKQPLLLFL